MRETQKKTDASHEKKNSKGKRDGRKVIDENKRVPKKGRRVGRERERERGGGGGEVSFSIPNK